ncbi:MAG: WYL domain-containing protein [Lachnospiraceae bacterium]|nr:WYL domain-containing protein [Lachnospiraceae bacterium]
MKKDEKQAKEVSADGREENKYLKGISVAERQIYILSLLSENPQGFRVQDIVEKLLSWDIEVKKRTIQRDIDELSLSYGISEEVRGGDVYYMADKYNLKNVDLTLSDLMSIAFLQELLDNYHGLAVADHGTEFLERLMRQTGLTKRAQLLDYKNIIKNMDDSRRKNLDVNPEIERTVLNAMNQKKKLRMTYYSWNRNESTERVIHPYRFVMNDGYLNVEGFCELRNALRNFRVSRMSNVVLLDEAFSPDKKLMAAQKPFLHLSGGRQEELVIRFDKSKGRFVKEYEAGRADRIVQEEDGEILFYKKTAITDEVRQYILGYGSHVKVLEPGWFAGEIEKEAEKMARRYQEKEKN